MTRASPLLIAAALLAACSPSTPSPEASAPAPEAAAAGTPAAEAPIPGESQAEEHADCQWGEVRGATLSIWSFTCADERLIADETLPGFVRETTDSATGQVYRTGVIQVFTKAPDALVASVIDQVRAAAPGAESCEIEPGSHGDHVLMPTGEAFEAWQRFVRGEADGPSNPCGPFGPTEGGGVTFRVVEGAPDKVVMIDWGTSPPIFDPDTLRATAGQ